MAPEFTPLFLYYARALFLSPELGVITQLSRESRGEEEGVREKKRAKNTGKKSGLVEMGREGKEICTIENCARLLGQLLGYAI